MVKTINLKRTILSPFWLISAMSVLNLLFMHYYMLFTASMDDEANYTRFFDNLFGIAFDWIAVSLFFFFLTNRKLKVTVSITFLITLLWSFANVLYSRFFHHYISLSAIAQGGSLFDSFMLDCIKSGLSWTDLYFIASLLLFFVLIRNTRIKVKRPITTYLSIFFICLIVDIIGYMVYCCQSPERRYIRFFTDRIEARHFSYSLQLCNPNVASFRRGSIRFLTNELVKNLQGPEKLNNDQKQEIYNFIKRQKEIHSYPANKINPQNVIFIIVESYMSFVDDLKIGNEEVTPFLNQLRRDSCTFYTGKMHKNVTIGESSDGQFIYMTGLLPLRSVVTISQARKNALPPALPKQLGYTSRMIIPTVETMWRQDEMCRQYGFDSLYTSKDYGNGYNSILTDEQVFQLAMKIDMKSDSPFFSVILTMSMHQPYTDQIDSSFPINAKSMRDDLASYLNKCHYTDKQLEVYFNHLKSTGLYDNSLIIIAADHPVLSTDFGGVSDNIPLYLIYSKGWPDNIWKENCNQVDVYSTLVHILCNNSQWYGLGRSLLVPQYKSTVSDSTWNLSERIIMGDFFQSPNNNE